MTQNRHFVVNQTKSQRMMHIHFKSVSSSDTNIINKFKLPQQIKYGCFFICTSGSAQIMINSQSYDLHNGSMCIFFPTMVIAISDVSEDFAGFIAGVNTESFIPIIDHSAISLFVLISNSPCISINDHQKNMILKLCKKSRDFILNTEHPYKEEIVRNILEIIVYEIAAIYNHNEPIVEQKVTHSKKVFQEFITLVANEHTISREVNYYAEKMCITPKYLSVLIKKASGKSANDWINAIVVNRAKTMLNKEDMTIQQIAYELKFPNASFFVQYFKRNMGITPKKYRDSLR